MSTTTPPEHIAPGLTRLGARPPLGDYVRQFVQRRHFMFELARARFESENEQDRLGIAWHVVRPLLNAAVYGLVFGVILESSTRPPNFLAFLVTGIFFFQFFASCLAEGARSITGNLGLVRTLHFPRALLPLSTVLKQLFAMVPMVTVLLVVVVATGERPSWNWLGVVPVLVLMTLFNAGVALIAARATIHVRDIAQLLPFITRLLFYISGIFYSIDRTVRAHPAVEKAFEFNPLNIYLSLARWSLIESQPAKWHYWIYGSVWAVVFAGFGFVWFWAAEERYGRE